MFFEWGMDITGQSSGSLGEIGSVNGTPVLYDQYMGTYRRLYDQVAEGQEDPITGAQIKELEDDAWEEVVNSIVIEQELERRGIVVTDEELINAARYSPPPEVVADPNYQTDGTFDIAKYQRFISVASRDVLLSLEAYYRNLIPRTKLLRQVGSGVYASDGELWDAYRSSHERTAVRYVSFDPLVRVSDEEFEISPDEVAGYYDEQDGGLLRRGECEGRGGADPEDPDGRRHCGGADQDRGAQEGGPRRGGLRRAGASGVCGRGVGPRGRRSGCIRQGRDGASLRLGRLRQPDRPRNARRFAAPSGCTSSR